MLSNDFIDSLSTEQKKIINSQDLHKILLAGAGSGKTREIVAEAVHRGINGVNKPILIIAFSNKAVAEVKERLTQITDINQQDIVVQTFHGWCWSIINSSPLFSRKENTIINENEGIKLLTSIINKMPKHGGVSAKKVFQIISFVKNTRRKITSVLKEKYPELVSKEDHITKLIKIYNTNLKEKNLMSFEDIITAVGKSINTNVDALNFVVSQYSAVLIDEAQDTNAAQWNIIKPIAKHLPITVVGDPAQAIYGFRGAKSNSIKTARKILPSAKVFKLKTNYRATPENVAFTNDILAGSTHYPKLKSNKANGPKPQIKSFLGKEHEAEFIVDKVVDLNAEGLAWDDIMIITRTNEDAQYIAEKLDRSWVPVTVAIENPIASSKYVLAIIAILTLASGIKKKTSMIRYFQLFKGIGIKSAEDISKYSMRGSYNNAVKKMPKKESLKHAVDLLRKVSCFNFAQEAIIEVTRFMDSCFFDKYSHQWDSNKASIQKWASTIDSSVTVKDFIEDGMLGGVLTHQKSDGVLIVTAHRSKGLQANTCILMNVSPDVYPFKLAKSSSDIKEERRIFYTAATRAEQNLFITSRLTTQGKYHFKINPNRSYCFLNDIKPNLYDS